MPPKLPQQIRALIALHQSLLLVAIATISGGCLSQLPEETSPSDPFADEVIAFRPGAGAGFGADQMPKVVLGPPHGGGDQAGGLDVVSLGRQGEIILRFDPPLPVDGPGPDLLVFENPFSGWQETGEVAASEDGVIWHTWSCDPLKVAEGSSGCAGLRPVYSNPDNGLSATDPTVAGGDAFDLADLHLKRARYLRIRDTGSNSYLGETGGFDLDAVAVVNSTPAPASP